MKYRKFDTIGVVCIIVMLLWNTSAYSTSMHVYTLEDLCTKSSDIIVARTVSVKCYVKPKTKRIYTDVELEVLDNLKGKLQKNNKIKLTLYGGTVDGVTTLVVGSPSFLEEKTSLLFLAEGKSPKAGPRRLRVKGLSQGKFNIFSDSETEKQMVVREQVSEKLRLDKDGNILELTNDKSMLLTDFLNQIKPLAK